MDVHIHDHEIDREGFRKIKENHYSVECSRNMLFWKSQNDEGRIFFSGDCRRPGIVLLCDSASILNAPKPPEKRKTPYSRPQETMTLRKPVLYLYADQPLEARVGFVNPEMETSYEDPPRQKDGCWHVIVHPDGHLKLPDGSTKEELYWEVQRASYVVDDKKCFPIKGECFDASIRTLLVTSGLSKVELDFFVDYWNGSFRKGRCYKIQFINDVYSEDYPLDIRPRPDGLYRLFMIFQRISFSSYFDLLHDAWPNRTVFPWLRPESGFIAVEWGGAEVESFVYDNEMVERCSLRILAPVFVQATAATTSPGSLWIPHSPGKVECITTKPSTRDTNCWISWEHRINALPTLDCHWISVYPPTFNGVVRHILETMEIPPKEIDLCVRRWSDSIIEEGFYRIQFQVEEKKTISGIDIDPRPESCIQITLIVQKIPASRLLENPFHWTTRIAFPKIGERYVAILWKIIHLDQKWPVYQDLDSIFTQPILEREWDPNMIIRWDHGNNVSIVGSGEKQILESYRMLNQRCFERSCVRELLHHESILKHNSAIRESFSTWYYAWFIDQLCESKRLRSFTFNLRTFWDDFRRSGMCVSDHP